MPPRASGQRATASRTSRVIVLTLPMTRSWTIGGKTSTARNTNQRSMPSRDREPGAATTRTQLGGDPRPRRRAALSGTRGTNSSAPNGVYRKVYVSDQS